MAVQTAEKFLERLEREPTLKAQLAIINPRSLRQFVTFAQGKGFIFSEDDLKAALAKQPLPYLKF
jgi:predicted ribosomally synthesized peptide with nif11-like leader